MYGFCLSTQGDGFLSKSNQRVVISDLPFGAGRRKVRTEGFRWTVQERTRNHLKIGTTHLPICYHVGFYATSRLVNPGHTRGFKGEDTGRGKTHSLSLPSWHHHSSLRENRQYRHWPWEVPLSSTSSTGEGSTQMGRESSPWIEPCPSDVLSPLLSLR